MGNEKAHRKREYIIILMKMNYLVALFGFQNIVFPGDEIGRIEDGKERFIDNKPHSRYP